MAWPLTWGATRAEARRPYAADHLIDGTMLTMTRAISVAAPPEHTWRWLCQIAVAPYSYDWIDNGGRRSPRTLTPGADDLVLGQPMAIVFELVAFDAPHHWTALTTARGRRLFGPVAMTYAAPSRRAAPLRPIPPSTSTRWCTCTPSACVRGETGGGASCCQCG